MVRSGSERRTETVTLLGQVQNPSAVLMPELIPGVRKPGRCSVDHVDGSRATESPDAFAGTPTARSASPVRPKFPGGQRKPELVQQFRCVENARAILSPKLRSG